MHIDYTPVREKKMKVGELATANSIGKEDLRIASDESIDAILALLTDCTDADIVFDPTDEEANDPYATKGEEEIGWSLAHLIVHVTASTEEGAAFSSLLARGIEAEERPRYETAWQSVTTKAQCVQRLEESRRMRNAYLTTWPDEPHLDVFRKMSERFTEFAGPLNAVSVFMFGLGHELGHFAQMEVVKAQAIAGR